MATALVELVVLLAAFAGVVAYGGPVVRRLTGWAARRRAVRHPVPAGRPVEAVAADLRRLGRQVELVPAGVPMARRRAVQAAYDDVLAEAAAILGVPTSLAGLADGRARDVERLRLLAALQAAGLRVPV
ncbi:hypothetical protein [Blastococcus sp. TF02A-35]|uniref:hypothetical protein n=1 Tax=Blastococcus sp. TF02A-35 TaxID=2559612 RepID=UPI001073D940|nr:hypothetical protein [Blastococcus sp. TF02A_35]TFV44169.1 hypothetical protein E4P43_19105 [Blastococcus sp. TF02A_35]